MTEKLLTGTLSLNTTNQPTLATHKVYSEDTDQTGQMPRLIRVFGVRTGDFVVCRLILLSKIVKVIVLLPAYFLK